MKILTNEQIRTLSDGQLMDKLGAVFEDGLEAEQDPTFIGTPAHEELLSFHTRLVVEANRRLAARIYPLPDAEEREHAQG